MSLNYGNVYSATNASQIVALQTSMASNTADIATANTNIASNTADIVTANTNIATNVTNIASNTADIVTANTNIATNTADIVTANNNITTANTNIATNASDITTANTNIATNVTNIATNTADIVTANTNIATNASAITALQNANPLSSKIETIDINLSYTTPSNILTHTYNEENIFLNTLDDNNVIELDLTITSPTNYKSYVQTVIIDCLEFKGYINTLKINGSVVEIKYKDGDNNINLAPIAGYSTIIQTFNLTRMNDTWYAMSDIQLFYNSISNIVYDVTPPVITLIEVNGSAIINHEINTTYTDAGATVIDNIDGDIYNSLITDTSAVNTAVLGTYNVSYTITDNAGNSATKLRVVNVVDTTNPVITLLGDNEITLDNGTAYVEPGYSASDNSLESITVMVSGSVDVNTDGDYTLTYSATDSTGNTHSVGRLIHIVTNLSGWQLKWSNPSIDIFQQLDFYNKLTALTDATLMNFTVTGQSKSIMDGNCECEWSSYGKPPRVIYGTQTLIASGGLKEWIARSGTFNHHIHGTTTINGTLYNSSGIYTGPSSTSIGGYTGFQSQLATNSNTYNGEFASVTFPFHFELKHFYVSLVWHTHNYVPCKVTVLGSNDDGTTYDFIHTSSISHNTIGYHDVDISSNTAKFKKYKVVFEETQADMTELHVEHIKFYGDVYEWVGPVPEVILYQNVSTDFLTLIPYATQLPYTGTPQSTHLSFTESGNANSWIDGDYQLNCSGEFGWAQTAIRGLVNGGHVYQGHATSEGQSNEVSDWLSLPYGTKIVSTTDLYGNNIGTGMEYVGYTVGGNNYKHTQLASNSTTYEGEWVEFKFPYQVDINSFEYSRFGNSIQSQRMPTRGVLLASNDGTTFDLLHSFNYDTEVVTINETVGTDSGKYTQFKFMFDKIGWSGTTDGKGIILNSFKIYANKICEP